MDAFLEVFGGIRVGTVVLAIAGIYFMYKVFRVVEKFFRERFELETEREEQMQDILEQVRQYPKWHEQSKQIRSGLKSAIDSLEVKIDHMSKSVDKLQISNDTGMALTWRYRILRFDDEIRHDEKHTKEHFDQILEDITAYERYCKDHPDFPNDKAKLAIKNIKEVYLRCAKERTFL